MRRKLIATLLALTLALGCNTIAASASTTIFADEDTTASWKWAKSSIYRAYEMGIVSGKEGNIFDAEGYLTRAEAATMLVKLKEIDPDIYGDTCEVFSDVEAGKWYTRYVNAAYDNGLISGKGEGIFDPEGYLTRAEAATLLVNVSGFVMDTPDCELVDTAGKWYTPYVNTAYAHQIVSGKGSNTFAPEDNVTRAQMAVMITTKGILQKNVDFTSDYTYDEYGRLVEEVFHSTYVEYTTIDQYLYNEDGQVIQRIYSDGDDGTVEEIVDYIYEDGKLIREEITDVDGDGETTISKEYSYYESGKLLSETQYYQIETRIFTYDEAGNLIQEKYLNGSGNESGRYEYIYSADGTEVIKNRMEGDEIEYTWTYKRAFSETGKLIEEEEKWQYIDGTYTRYTYNEADQLIQETVYEEKGGVIWDWIKYEYDEAGNCIKRTIYNYQDMFASS